MADDHPLDEHIAALKKASETAATFKQRYPASALKGLGKADEGPNMDKAFSNTDTEYQLGNALRAAARRMKAR